MACKPEICLPTPKLDKTIPWKTSQVGRGTNHDHALLARSELVPRDNDAGNRTAKKFPACRVAPVDAWMLSSQTIPGTELHNGLHRKSQTHALRVPERITSRCLNTGAWVPLCVKKNRNAFSFLCVFP